MEKPDVRGQSHLLAFWDRLGAAEQASLAAQISEIDWRDVARMREALRAGTGTVAPVSGAAPPAVRTLGAAERAAFAERGAALYMAGKTGIMMIAGGQGSRLGFDGPKGCYPIGPVSGRPLFYFHARKVLALEKRFGAPVPFYVMTGPGNDSATRAAFEENSFFGLDRGRVMFFCQRSWPALTPDGDIILETPSRIFRSPDGHGGVLSSMLASGVFGDMEKRGLKHLFFFQVDNPLCAVGDPVFIGFHDSEDSEYSLKVTRKRSGTDTMGTPAVVDGRPRMLEYTDPAFTEDIRTRLAPDGDLALRYGNTSTHVFSVEFLKRVASAPLPLHLAFKKIPCVGPDGAAVKPEKPNGYKFEKFIFDILPLAEKTAFLAFERDEEYAPVKDRTGSNTPERAQELMQRAWRKVLAERGVTPPDGPFELDPASVTV